jgi:Xaa-Pro dipeptidase
MQTTENPFAHRVRRALDMAQQRRLSGLMLVPGPNLRYLTGLSMHASERLALALLAPGANPAFVLPSFEVSRAEQDSGMEADLFGYTDEEGPKAALSQACRRLEWTGASVGAESLHMRLMEMWRLQEAGIQVASGDEILTALRMRKDAHELAAMREAAARTDRVLQAFLSEMRPGRTEQELAAKLRSALMEASGEDVSFSPILVAGPNGALPHGGPSERPLQTGDLITIDCGMVYSGYVSDITRTFALGEPEPELRRVYETVRVANRAGREACRPGATAESVDRAARAVIRDAGYGEFFTHRTGHGIGLEVHEPPYIVEGNSTMLEPGMTFTVEPGVYLPGRGGVRIEDDVAITPDGVEVLTSFPRELIVL